MFVGGGSGRHRAIALLIAFAAIGAPSTAAAATISVDTTADEYGIGPDCGLREAINAAEAESAFGGCAAGSSGADTIDLPPGTYLLTRNGPELVNSLDVDDLDVFSPVTIRNTGRRPAVIDANGIDRALEALAAAPGIELVGLTIRGGVSVGDGGAINSSGPLTIRDSTLAGNFADDGEGGAIFTTGNDSALVLENVTVSANRADESGGGISVEGGQSLIRNSTLTANIADADATGSPAFGGGLFANVGVTSVRDTIIAGNSDSAGFAPDCTGQGLGSDGNNLVGDATGCDAFLSPMGSDLVGAAANLGPLTDNGGPTPTHALLEGSAAVDKGSSVAPTADQRGAPRAGSGDIGAYERVLCAGVLVNRVGTSGRDALRGTSGRDGILGLAGNDKLIGLRGKDSLCGGDGRDRLLGGRGRDRLLGQRGRDTLRGGPGRDKLRGGPGRDIQTQ